MAALSGQLDGLVKVIQHLQDRPGVALHQAGHAFIQHVLARIHRVRLDAHFTFQQAVHVVVIKHIAAASRQAQAGPADHH